MIRGSVFYTYFVQIYSALISVIFIPLYITRVGVEEFGLIGFLVVLQNVLQILDAGVSGSITRQVSVAKQGHYAFKIFLKQFSIIVLFFIVISAFLIIFGFLNAQFISQIWLNSQLSGNVLNISIASIFLILAFRYLSGPFRGGIIGLEEHKLLAAINFFVASMRFPGGYIILVLNNDAITAYFIYQVFVSIVELILMIMVFLAKSKTMLKKESFDNGSRLFNSSLKSFLLFSGQLSLLSIVWIVVSQIDKFTLSKYLTLHEFGFYSLSVTVAGVIMVFSVPLSQILMSRLTVLIVQNKKKEYLDLYSKSYLVLIVVLIPLTIFMNIFGKEIILVWTGDIEIANKALFYLKWLVLGNLASVLATFLFLLQYSIGQLKIHTLVYTIYGLILTPVTVMIAMNYKGEGAVLFWFLHNTLFFVFWGMIVHKKYIIGFNSYLWLDLIVPVTIISFLYFSMYNWLIDFTNMDRFKSFVVMFIAGISCIGVVFLYLKVFKNKIDQRFNKIRLTEKFIAH